MQFKLFFNSYEIRWKHEQMGTQTEPNGPVKEEKNNKKLIESIQKICEIDIRNRGFYKSQDERRNNRQDRSTTDKQFESFFSILQSIYPTREKEIIASLLETISPNGENKYKEEIEETKGIKSIDLEATTNALSASFFNETHKEELSDLKGSLQEKEKIYDLLHSSEPLGYAHYNIGIHETIEKIQKAISKALEPLDKIDPDKAKEQLLEAVKNTIRFFMFYFAKKATGADIQRLKARLQEIG